MSDMIQSELLDMGIVDGWQIYLIIDPATGDELGQIRTAVESE